MTLRLVPPKGDGVAEHLAEEPMGQMPPVPGLHPLDEVAVHAWTEHGINLIPEAVEQRAVPGPGFPSGFRERRRPVPTL